MTLAGNSDGSNLYRIRTACSAVAPVASSRACGDLVRSILRTCWCGRPKAIVCPGGGLSKRRRCTQRAAPVGRTAYQGGERSPRVETQPAHIIALPCGGDTSKVKSRVYCRRNSNGSSCHQPPLPRQRWRQAPDRLVPPEPPADSSSHPVRPAPPSQDGTLKRAVAMVFIAPKFRWGRPRHAPV